MAAEVPVNQLAHDDGGGETAHALGDVAQAGLHGVEVVGVLVEGGDGGGDDHHAGEEEAVVEEDDAAFLFA